MSRLTRMVFAAGSALRNAWLMLGVTLVMLLVLEVAYRAQASVRKSLRKSAQAEARLQHPYSGQPWFAGFEVEHAATELPTRALEWTSYVYWKRRPYPGRYISVDTAGHRVTPQPSGEAQARPIWFFGGSTMWGTYQRDSATIPSVAARRWAGRDGHLVVNFGEYGYVFTQEVLALELALRRGGRPAVVVFLDGLNDVASASMNGRAGVPQNEINRISEFRLGRLLSPEGQGTADEPRALGATTLLVLRRFAFVERVLQAAPRPRQAGRPAAELGAEVSATYAATAEWVEALAARYGFVPFYVWQPSSLTTGKTLTAYERLVIAQAPSAEGERLRADIQRAAETGVDSAMSRLAPGRFVNLSRIFDADTASVFLDYIGHTTEAGAARIGQAIADTVSARLNAPTRRRLAGTP